jgi:NADH:ubiquinone oxidoreductase subunit 5 (subunit L)/multisubunit Na+/H+ antiporter MnhA subunit
MEWIILILAAILLPVFPLSWIFNRLIDSAPGPWGRGLAILVLPQLGILLLYHTGPLMPLPLLAQRIWLMVVLFTAVFYAFRAVSAREISIWSRLTASSGLTLSWLLVVSGTPLHAVQLFALAWSLPAALLMLWAGMLSQRMGGAYLGLRGGLATELPRLSGLITVTALALVATPVFPSFFALLQVFQLLDLSWLWPLLLLLMIWGWSIGKFLQDLLFGIYRGEPLVDVGGGMTSVGAGVLVLFALFGLIWSGAWIGI